MKRALIIISSLALVVFVGKARAVTVDFSNVDVQDITTQYQLQSDGSYISTESPVSVGGITFTYDKSPESLDSAFVSSIGIFGTANGILKLDFALPATNLILDFVVLDFIQPSNPALLALFFGNGNWVGDTSVDADYSQIPPLGQLGYTGSPFDHVELLFLTEAPSVFMIDNISYAPVPEPGTLLLFASGLLGLGGWRIARRSLTKQPA